MRSDPGGVQLSQMEVNSEFFELPAPQELENRASIQALYVHVPFCSVKCHYCDFYSLAGHLDEAREYLDALAAEIKVQTDHFGVIAPETIFIGGGTPTLLAPDDLADLVAAIRAAVDMRRLIEFTVEANPNTFDPDKARILKAAGVNRISFGAQSFVPGELTALQRDHDPQSVPLAVAAARNAGIQNINLDLIYAIPSQTLESLQFSLNKALDCEPEHLSCYGLMYEPNTPLTARLRQGQVTPVDEQTEITMLRLVQEKLAGAGLGRYEISNFARPGRECRHNLHYWNAANHLAWGPSAAAHHSGRRWKNVPSLMRWRDALRRLPARVPLVESEHLTGLKRWGELAILRLRLRDGIEFDAFRRRTGIEARDMLAGVLRKYEGLGLLDINQKRLTLTDAAIAVSDTIFADVLAAFHGSHSCADQAC
jgi:oxygen-independent coproporphyrinogen III oxidase